MSQLVFKRPHNAASPRYCLLVLVLIMVCMGTNNTANRCKSRIFPEGAMIRVHVADDTGSAGGELDNDHLEEGQD